MKIQNLLESKQDIENFINKFGQETYDLFIKSKDRLKNNKLSTDLTWHTKNTTPEEMDNMLASLQQKVGGNKDLSQTDFSDRQIPGKYKYFGRMGNYDVYQPLDVEASMALGVNTGWCTTGRYGHYGDPNFKPSLKDAKEHWNDYTSKGIEFYYLLDPKTHYGEIAIAKYPKVLDYYDANIPDVIETKNELIQIDNINFEIFNAKDDNDYSQIDDLPSEFMGKFGLVIDYKIILDKRKMPKIQKENIKGITLLSIDEAKNLSDYILRFSEWWWLRSPGYDSFNAALVAFDGDVDDYGFRVSNEDNAVRPALLCFNLKPLNLKIGDYVNAFDKIWQYIGKDMILLFGKPLTLMAFREDCRASDANDYEKSDVKKYLDNWFKEQMNKQEKPKEESLCEAFSIGKGTLAFVSGYDLLNWLEDQKYSVRIFYDKLIHFYFACDAYDNVHFDLFNAAIDNGLYKFPFKYVDKIGKKQVANTKWDMENYRNNCNSMSHISFMFTPNTNKEKDEEAYNDNYKLIYEISNLGAFYFRKKEDLNIFDESDLYDQILKKYHEINLVTDLYDESLNESKRKTTMKNSKNNLEKSLKESLYGEDRYLYHATDEKFVNDILKNGLLIHSPNRNWKTIDTDGAIHFAFDAKVAEHYATIEEIPPEKIAVLKVKLGDLDQSCMGYDWNNYCEYEEDINSVQYKKDIPSKYIKVCDPNSEPSQTLEDFEKTPMYYKILDTFDEEVDENKEYDDEDDDYEYESLNESCIKFAEEELVQEGLKEADELKEDGSTIKYYIGYTTEDNEDKVFKTAKDLKKLRFLVKDLLANKDKLDTLSATALYVNSVGDDDEVFVALKDEDTDEWEIISDEFETYENKSVDYEYKDIPLNRVYYSLTGTFPDNFKAKAPSLYDNVIRTKKGMYVSDGYESGYMFDDNGNAIIRINIDRTNKEEENKVIDWVNTVANHFNCPIEKLKNSSFKITIPDQEKWFID